MNVLLTSASRKVWLVRAFQWALAAEGGGRVVAADADPRSAAWRVADGAVRLPRDEAPDWADRVLAACHEHRIELLVPTRDEELPRLAALRGELAARGVRVAVSPPEVLERCGDKWAFACFCRDAGLPAVSAWIPGCGAPPPSLPVVVKPRWGKGGAGVLTARTPAEFEAALVLTAHPLVQPLMSGPEYTLDVCADFDGRVLTVVPRRRERVFGGESFVGCTVADPRLEQAGAALTEALGLRGPGTIQLFEQAGRPYFSEVNPRFGGGAALGIAAGVDTPRLLVRMALGRSVSPARGAFTPGLRMLRYTADLFEPVGEEP